MIGGEELRLTFVCDFKLNEIQEKIIKEIKWHCSKVYNTFNYAIREGKVDVSKIKRVNEDGGKIYKNYRDENWHSKYLHSHTLQQIILNCIRDHKSYLALKEMYEKGNKDIGSMSSFWTLFLRIFLFYETSFISSFYSKFILV